MEIFFFVYRFFLVIYSLNNLLVYYFFNVLGQVAGFIVDFFFFLLQYLILCYGFLFICVFLVRFVGL